MEGVFGAHAWGWSIIALTLVVRILLLPLAIKQTRSMRAMQALQPQIKQIQAKHKTDREMLKRDPQKYQDRKKKMNEEVMGLYKEHNVNPASGCLPLLPQIPIFFALFSVLRSPDFAGASKPFYFFTDFISSSAEFQGLGAKVNEAGWPGWLLVVGMAVTMFITQRQMMAKNNAEGPQAQQQKILMYVMPVFLAFISQSLPLGVLLYWVTTNLWQGVQQYVVLYEVEHHPEGPGSDVDTGTKSGRWRLRAPKTKDVTGTSADRSTGNGRPSKGASSKGASSKQSRSGARSNDPSGNGQSTRTPKSPPKSPSSDHLPRRKGRSGHNR